MENSSDDPDGTLLTTKQTKHLLMFTKQAERLLISSQMEHLLMITKQTEHNFTKFVDH